MSSIFAASLRKRIGAWEALRATTKNDEELDGYLILMLRYFCLLFPILPLAGCATMFNPNHAKVEFYAPKEVVAHYENGEAISIIPTDSNASFFYAKGGDDEAVIFDYKDHIRRVELGKNVNPWTLLNVESDGVGFLVDDASNAWYTYEPFYVFLEPLSNHPDSESIRTPYRKGWFYDFHRPNILLTAGWGGSSGLQGEWGIGIGYRHLIDLLYRKISADLVALSPSLGDQNYSGVTVSNAIELRVYPLGGLFLEGGFGRVTISADTIQNRGNNVNFLAYPPWSNTFSELLGGIGWAGDISYIEMQYYHGLSDYRYFDLPPLRLEGVSVTYGLYLRL